MPASAPPPAAETEAGARRRILHRARTHFFAHGYLAFTMDDLAAELGMSKKTLYVHFSGKDEIIGAVLRNLGDETRADAEAILRNRELNFAEKLRGFVEGMMERLAALDPRTLRELQRHAPALFARVDEMRRKNVPYIFGQLIEEGQAAGYVREDLPVSFAIEFFLNAMQGIVQGPVLDQLRLAPSQAIAQGIDLFFGGLLTTAGRKQYEKLFPR
jgi:AcrR family transcriptional regulator